MKIAVQKSHLVAQIWYRSSDPVKNSVIIKSYKKLKKALKNQEIFEKSKNKTPKSTHFFKIPHAVIFFCFFTKNLTFFQFI